MNPGASFVIFVARPFPIELVSLVKPVVVNE